MRRDCKNILIYLLFIFLLTFKLGAAATNFTDRTAKAEIHSVTSPDGNTVFELCTLQGSLKYRVRYENAQVTGWSDLGFMLQNKEVGLHTGIKHVSYSSCNQSFYWRLGENDRIVNHYNAAIFTCGDRDVIYSVSVRVYKGSVAFRYELAMNKSIGQVTAEKTSFDFDQDLTIYQYNQESVFTPVDLNSMNKSCDFPATLTNGKNLFISIGEADNRDYTKAELVKKENENSLCIAFTHDSAVSLVPGFVFPWRTISISTTAIGLHAYSDLYLRLTGNSKDTIPSWVRPGKLIRAQLTTEDGIRAVDFASRHHFQYVLFDAGWYGKEFNSTSDPRKYIDKLNIPEVISYGKSKNIGIVLYVNYVGLRNYLDDIIPLYKKWGVAGIKFGFVDGLSQKGIQWLVKAVKKVTDAGLIVDVHDNYKPTGLGRLIPGWLTQEGIRGDENSPDAFHTTVLPFTRFLAGPADFTFCYPNSKNSFSKNLKVSKAQQLALTVVYFSPLQAIFWYGRPEDYTSEQDIEFFKYVPTVWDETHYLAGAIGKYISVARRKGGDWFIGNAAGPADWRGEINLDFLQPGKLYHAEIWKDGSDGKLIKSRRTFKKGDKLEIHIKGAQGSALILRPES